MLRVPFSFFFFYSACICVNSLPLLYYYMYTCTHQQQATTTAGNASQLSDGASACVVMEGNAAAKLSTQPLGIFKVTGQRRVVLSVFFLVLFRLH